MTPEDRKDLRALVRTMYDYQDMRIRTANRIRVKANGHGMAEEFMDEAEVNWSDYKLIEGIRIESEETEKKLKKKIFELVHSHPIWDKFFKGVKGCGEGMAAVILSEFDIHKADTVSRMYQFAGLNPGMIRGKKIISITKKTDMSQVIREYTNKEGKLCGIILTDEMIRGDRLQKDFVSPFNKWLRTKLCGVLAASMMKQKSSYYLDFYLPYKARLEQEEVWKDRSKGHRHNAAKRYMIKMFLYDLYKAWREVEGLPVRVPYQEEYLGHTHREPTTQNETELTM